MNQSGSEERGEKASMTPTWIDDVLSAPLPMHRLHPQPFRTVPSSPLFGLDRRAPRNSASSRRRRRRRRWRRLRRHRRSGSPADPLTDQTLYDPFSLRAAKNAPHENFSTLIPRNFTLPLHRSINHPASTRQQPESLINHSSSCSKNDTDQLITLLQLDKVLESVSNHWFNTTKNTSFSLSLNSYWSISQFIILLQLDENLESLSTHWSNLKINSL